MSEVRHKSRAWIWWTAIVLFVIYPVTAMPFIIAGDWCVKVGVIPDTTYQDTFKTIYAPVLWTLDRSSLLQRADDFFNEHIRPRR